MEQRKQGKEESTKLIERQRWRINYGWLPSTTVLSNWLWNRCELVRFLFCIRILCEISATGIVLHPGLLSLMPLL
jgi:hypothetical protein